MPATVVGTVGTIPFILYEVTVGGQNGSRGVVDPSSLLVLVPAAVIAVNNCFVTGNLVCSFNTTVTRLPAY